MSATPFGLLPRKLQRRVVAVLQLVLFVFSTSSALLPCALSDTLHDSQRQSALLGAHAAHQGASASHDSGPHERPLHHAPTTPMSSGTCPWVVGCVGMVQFDLDASWRVVESVTVSSAPIGVTLKQMVVDRDVESPPPRA